MPPPSPYKKDDHVKHTQYGTGRVVHVNFRETRVDFGDNRVLGFDNLDLSELTPTTAPPPRPAPGLAIVDPEPSRPPEPPAKAPTPSDPLWERLEAEIQRRGPGAAKAVTAACGINPQNIHHWRRNRRIPLSVRPTVEAWCAEEAVAPLERPDDPLFLAMEEAIAKRGKGACQSVTAAAGLHKTALTIWRHRRAIPDDSREAVQAWVGNPTPETEDAPVPAETPAPKATKRTIITDDPVWHPNYGPGIVVGPWGTTRLRVHFDEHPSLEWRLPPGDLWHLDDPARPPRAAAGTPAPANIEAPVKLGLPPVIPSGINYVAVLDDLIAKRDALDRAIEAVRTLITP